MMVMKVTTTKPMTAAAAWLIPRSKTRVNAEELGGGQIGVEMIDDVVGHVSTSAAQRGQLGYPGAAHLDDGELGYHEESIDQD
jgi:hypothetical protein